MITQKVFFENYRNVVGSFFGLSISFSYGSDDELEDIKIDDVKKDSYEIIDDNPELIVSSVKKVLLNFYETHKNSSFRPIYGKLLMEELAYSFIDNSYPQINKSFSDFVENIKQLSIKTYESECTQMGFIIVKDDSIEISNFFINNDLKYIPFSDPQDLFSYIQEKQTLKVNDSKSVCFVINANYQVIGLAQKMKAKQSIKDIMMRRYRYLEENDIKMLAHDYYVESQIPDSSNHSEALNKVNELKKETINNIKHDLKIKSDEMNISSLSGILDEIQFTEEQEVLLMQHLRVYSSLQDKEIEVLGDRLNVIEQEAASRKYFRKIEQERERNLQNEIDIKKVEFVYFKNKQIIWSSSYNYIVSFTNGQWTLRNYVNLRSILTKFIMSQYSFSNIPYTINKINYSIPRVLDLYSLIKEFSDKNIGTLICILKKSNHTNQTIYKSMLQKKELSSKQYISIIQTEKRHPINIKSCDPYLFELVGSIDGAILMDYKLNILSFGEMISSRVDEVNDSSIEYRGARTLAAISASYYGLSLKISEDGDILVFENGKEIARV